MACSPVFWAVGQLSRIDSSSTIAMLDKMKQKVAEEESLATAYGEVAATTVSLDVRVNEALAAKSADARSSLEDLKRKMGLLPPPTGNT